MFITFEKYDSTQEILHNVYFLKLIVNIYIYIFGYTQISYDSYVHIPRLANDIFHIPQSSLKIYFTFHKIH